MLRSRLKVLLGALLMAPLFCGSLYSWLYSMDYPSLTQAQISNIFLPYLLLAIPPAMAGIVLLHSGLEDYDDE